MFIRTAVTILSLGVHATGELCTDSTLEVKTDWLKASCDELIASDHHNCTQPTIMHHCKESCGVDFCCSDSQASFAVQLPGMPRPKYKKCSWKALKKHCGNSTLDLLNTCPVTCGKCNPMSALLGMIGEQGKLIGEQGELIGEQGEEVDGLKSKSMDQADTIKNQTDVINGLKNEVIKQEKMIKYHREQIEAIEDEVFDFSYNYVYKLAEELMTWAAHEAAAVEWGGHLASIHSKEENIFISNFITGYTSGYSWVGLKERGETNWEWSDGTPFDYSNWREGEPNNHGGVEHVAGPNSSGQWVDHKETNTYPGIYKKRRVH